MTHICVGNLTIIGSDNGLSPDRRQVIIWTNAGLLLTGPSGTNFSEILIEILTFSFKKMRLKVPSAKRQPFCLGLNVLYLLWTGALIVHLCSTINIAMAGWGKGLVPSHYQSLWWHYAFLLPEAIGYCRCLGLCVFVSMCVSVCVKITCLSRDNSGPVQSRDNSGPVQARITKFGPKMQKTLVKVLIVLGGNWPWPSRSNLT